MANTTNKKKAPAAQPSQSGPKALTIKLQIAGGVCVRMLALGLWLSSKGFFG